MYFKKLYANITFIFKNFHKIVSLSAERKVGDILTKNALKLSTAESCTGGLVSSRLTDVSGASAYIFQNFVTYANSAKIELLGVNPETIDKNGVVSNEAALEMIQGLLERYKCDIAVAVTGIAGPGGATETKPVGLVYIGIGDKKVQKAYKYEANSLLCRPLMKYAFVLKVFDLLLEFLEKYN